MPFDVEKSQADWRDVWDGAVEVGPIASEVLFENEQVRVWDLTLKPGQTSPLHTHMNPYFFIPLEQVKILTRFANGSTSEDDDPVGQPVWVGLEAATRTHTVTNLDDHTYVGRVIEVLNSKEDERE